MKEQIPQILELVKVFMLYILPFALVVLTVFTLTGAFGKIATTLETTIGSVKNILLTLQSKNVRLAIVIVTALYLVAELVYLLVS